MGEGEDRRQPHRLHPQVAQVVEVLGQAAQVADAVTIGIRERARIDLVDRAGAATKRARADMRGRRPAQRAGRQCNP